MKDYLASENYQNDATIAEYEIYTWLIAKEKAIYTAINMMRSRVISYENEASQMRIAGQASYVGFMWIPFEDEKAIDDELAKFEGTEFKAFKNGDGN